MVHHEKETVWPFNKERKDIMKKKDDTSIEPQNQTSGLSSVVTQIPDLNRSYDNIDNIYCEIGDLLKPNGQHEDHAYESEKGNKKLTGSKPQIVLVVDDSRLDCQSDRSFRVTAVKVMDVEGGPEGVILNDTLKSPYIDKSDVDLAKISASSNGQDQNARLDTREIMIKPKYPAKNKTGDVHSSENSLSTNKIEISGEIKTKDKVEPRRVAQVLPSNWPKSVTKEFHLLTVAELNERLKICGMEDFAVFCLREKINGAFLSNMDEEALAFMELTKFHVQKLKQIMTGWVPR